MLQSDDMIITKIRNLLKQGELIKIERLMDGLKVQDVSLAVLHCLISVFKLEVANNECYSIFDYSVDLDELKEHFIYLKLLLRRLEFDLPKEDQEELYEYYVKTKPSKYLIGSMVLNNIFFQEKVCNKLIMMFQTREGIDSEYADYFNGILQSVIDKKNN